MGREKTVEGKLFRFSYDNAPHRLGESIGGCPCHKDSINLDKILDTFLNQEVKITIEVIE